MTDLFFYLSKLLWFIVQPDHLLLLMLLFGLLLWRRAGGVFLVWSSVLIMMLVSQFPIANYALQPLESQFSRPDLSALDQPLAGVIVLGGGEDAELSAFHQSDEFNSGAERLMSLPALMLRNPQLKVIYTGGSGSLMRPEYRGADVAQHWLNEQGLAGQLVIERDSRNTHQNALYTRELINEIQPDTQGQWLLITSAFHMPRSVGVFRKVGIDVIPYPVDYRAGENRWRPNLNHNMADLNLAVREWLGLLAYYYTDKTERILPHSDDISTHNT